MRHVVHKMIILFMFNKKEFEHYPYEFSFIVLILNFLHGGMAKDNSLQLVLLIEGLIFVKIIFHFPGFFILALTLINPQ